MHSIPSSGAVPYRPCRGTTNLPTTRTTIGASLSFAGYSFEWRIEYRATDGTGISPDPADPEKTLRVLTLYTATDFQVR